MNKLIIIVALLSLLQLQLCMHLSQSILAELVNLDYSDISTSYSNVQIISDKYASFKEKVQKNTTLSYAHCVDSIKELKCNNVDQWQSVIEELKLEIQNSEEIEIPFLQETKQQKIDELRVILWSIQSLDYENAWSFNVLKEFGMGIENSTKQIKIMYKIPEINEEQSEFVQKQGIEPAQESLAKAKEEYDIADISIQAQTTTNVMTDLANKIPILKQNLNDFYNQQMNSLQQKKERLKEEILHLRALLANERAIQQKNKDKITELEGKISSCKGKPTNIEKDCGPILITAEKLYTEIDIINARTNILIKELSTILKSNGQEQTAEQWEEYMKNNQKQQEINQDYDFASQNEKDEIPTPFTPQEQQPIHHINQPQIINQPSKQTASNETEPMEEIAPLEEVEPIEGEPPIEGQPIEGEPPIEGQPIEGEPPIEGQPIEGSEPPKEMITPENEATAQVEETITTANSGEQEGQIDENSEQMIFSYKQNKEYQSINDNNDEGIDDEENSLEKILEKEFANEDTFNETEDNPDSDTYADKFDFTE